MRMHVTSRRWRRHEKAIKRKTAKKSGPVKELVPQEDGTLAAIPGDARKRQTKSRTRSPSNRQSAHDCLDTSKRRRYLAIRLREGGHNALHEVRDREHNEQEI